MRKLFIAMLCLLFAGLCACVQVVPEEVSTTAEVLTTALFGVETTAIAPPLSPEELKKLQSGPYAEAIKTLKKSYASAPEQFNNLHFALYDIDGNGTKELLLSYGANPFIDAIYTIQNGVAVPQEAYPYHDISEWSHVFWLYKNGVIKTRTTSHEDETSYSYYRFEDGTLKRQPVTYNDKDSSIYISLTQEEFKQTQKELEGDSKAVTLNWKPLVNFGSNPGPYSNAAAEFIEGISQYETPDLNEYRYALYDIDGNGADELLLYRKMPNFYNGIYENHRYEVCYLQGGAAVREYIGDSDVPLLVLQNGLIKLIWDRHWDQYDETKHYYYSRISEEGLKWQARLYNDPRLPALTYKIVPITEEEKTEFLRLQKQLEGDGQTVTLTWRPLADYAQ